MVELSPNHAHVPAGTASRLVQLRRDLRQVGRQMDEVEDLIEAATTPEHKVRLQQQLTQLEQQFAALTTTLDDLKNALTPLFAL